jgi:hypothetical protein
MKPIKTRRIAAYPKATAADTQYWDIDSEDEAYIYRWLYRLLADITEEATFDSELQRDWFRRQPGRYPKGRRGPNSHASILAGICSAKLRDAKKNLSTPQLDVVEQIMNMAAQYYSDEPDAPESVQFDRKIFSIDT